jgi:high affinity sulfate transporter 1
MKFSFGNSLVRVAPGLGDLLAYRPADMPADVRAGLAVASVALPVGIAYAQLAGFDPVVGLYSSLFPLLMYFLFGSSRQLVIGPDAATCTLVAITVTPMAAGDPQAYVTLSALLCLLAGVFCIGASLLRLGALADFLSRPILIGFLNGVGISIAVGQVGKLFGVSLDGPNALIVTAVELWQKIHQTHLPTLAVGTLAFVVLLLATRLLKNLPAALVAMVVAAAAVFFLGLQSDGVATLGLVPAGLPALGLPAGAMGLFALHHESLLLAAAGIALISFTSTMLTSRSFAAKNRYDVDADRDFAALGAANIVSALSQGFAIAGADSRTAMSDTSGGRTRLAGLFAAFAIGLVLLFLTAPLQYVPVAALGAVLVMAGLSLVNLQALRHFWSVDRLEFSLSLIATVGVIWVGALNAVLFVVLLALLRFVKFSARPLADSWVACPACLACTRWDGTRMPLPSRVWCCFVSMGHWCFSMPATSSAKHWLQPISKGISCAGSCSTCCH